MAGQVSAERHTSTPYTVTANLNLRAEPSTKAKVLLVIPKGGTITLNAQEKNGFYSINYKGTIGWSFAQYIVPAGSSGGDPVINGQRKAAANVNLRSGPGTSYKVLRVVSSGSVVQSSDTVKNGFRYVVHQGLPGWMADSYLAHVGPSQGPGYDPAYATATANLNLRQSPNLSAKVLLVIPSGATVRVEARASGQFRQVTYKGTTGWAAYAYLN